MATSSHIFPTDLGWMGVAWNGNKLARITFDHPSASAATAALEADVPDAQPAGSPPEWIAELIQRLQSYAAGHAEQFGDVPLDLTHLSKFQASVVKACRKIGHGKVRTYGELAAAAGSPGAARAVGSVMSKNRFPIVVPCHRVVGAGNSLGGFSSRDGLCMKERMLALEGLNRARKVRRVTASRS